MEIRFLIYGLLGWCLEVFWTGLGSLLKGDVTLMASTSIWMFPIYGLAIILEPIHNRLRGMHIVLRGVVYTLVIFTIEYTTGSLLRLVLGICPWNYNPSRFSINGIIRLDYAPVWFTSGLLFERVHDILTGLQSTVRSSTR